MTELNKTRGNILPNDGECGRESPRQNQTPNRTLIKHRKLEMLRMGIDNWNTLSSLKNALFVCETAHYCIRIFLAVLAQTDGQRDMQQVYCIFQLSESWNIAERWKGGIKIFDYSWFLCVHPRVICDSMGRPECWCEKDIRSYKHTC